MGGFAVSRSLYQSTLPCSRAIGGQSAYLWLLARQKTAMGCLCVKACAAATSTRRIGRVCSPFGDSVYRLWFPTRRVRGPHGRPTRPAVFCGCSRYKPICCVNARPEDGRCFVVATGALLPASFLSATDKGLSRVDYQPSTACAASLIPAWNGPTLTPPQNAVSRNEQAQTAALPVLDPLAHLRAGNA